MVRKHLVAPADKPLALTSAMGLNAVVSFSTQLPPAISSSLGRARFSVTLKPRL